MNASTAMMQTTTALGLKTTARSSEVGYLLSSYDNAWRLSSQGRGSFYPWAWPCCVRNNARPKQRVIESGFAEQLRQLGDIHRDPPRLIVGEQLDSRAVR